MITTIDDNTAPHTQPPCSPHTIALALKCCVPYISTDADLNSLACVSKQLQFAKEDFKVRGLRVYVCVRVKDFLLSP